MNKIKVFDFVVIFQTLSGYTYDSQHRDILTRGCSNLPAPISLSSIK